MCTLDGHIWSYDKNPYVSEHPTCPPELICSNNQMCGGGMVNMTGTNLTGIMEAMKFASHSTAYKDFLSLREKVSKSNFTYTVRSSMDISESPYYYNVIDSSI